MPTGRPCRRTRHEPLMPILTTLALVALVPQDVAPSSRPMRDRVSLRVGAVLEGMITVDTKDYLEVRIDDGTTLGFERKLVESVERAVASPAAAPKTPGANLAARDRWFLLHDGEGTLKGRVHETLTV